MPELDLALTIGAFFAGMLTFLAPCTLPLVPVFLSFISGVSLAEIGKNKIAADSGAKKRILKNAVLYIIGFSAVFISFGVLAGALGAGLAPFRKILTRFGGAIVIIFGIYLLGFFRLGFFSINLSSKLTSRINKNSPLAALVFGAAFASGWTPCVGPIVGSILLLASAKATALSGAFLLGIFSLGLAVPFLASALLITSVAGFLKKIQSYLKWIEFAAGMLIITLGLLLITDNLVLLIPFGYKIFNFINYDKILNYL